MSRAAVFAGRPAVFAPKRIHAGIAVVLPILQIAAVLFAGILHAGCVAERMTVNIGWRSAQAGSCTNVLNSIDGGGKPSLSVPMK